MSGINSDVLLFEIDKINNALKGINSDTVLDEVAKANAKLDNINVGDVITEIHRVEAIVSEINENAVLAELSRLKSLILEKNSTEVMIQLDDKIRQLSAKDYSDQLLEIQDAISKNGMKIDELMMKVDRVATMPTMIKSVVEKNNESNQERMEEIITDLNNRERKKTDSMKMVININLWVSLLTAAVLIAHILGII